MHMRIVPRLSLSSSQRCLSPRRMAAQESGSPRPSWLPPFLYGHKKHFKTLPQMSISLDALTRALDALRSQPYAVYRVIGPALGVVRSTGDPVFAVAVVANCHQLVAGTPGGCRLAPTHRWTPISPLQLGRLGGTCHHHSDSLDGQRTEEPS